jgi:hypothetical protein
VDGSSQEADQVTDPIEKLLSLIRVKERMAGATFKIVMTCTTSLA